MELIWFLISQEARVKLAGLFKKLAGSAFIPPIDYEPLVRVDAKMESGLELERQMKKPTRFRRRPK